MENMMDQSHVAYSHSGVAGNRSAHISPATSQPVKRTIGSQAQTPDGIIRKFSVSCLAPVPGLPTLLFIVVDLAFFVLQLWSTGSVCSLLLAWWQFACSCTQTLNLL